MAEYDEDKLQKALVTLAIEQALIEFNNASFELVTSQLLSDFDSYLSDCYQNPEYLKKILVDLYGDSHNTIVNSIKQHLGEYTDRKGISKFLHRLTKK
jgi:hypothetical protein